MKKHPFVISLITCMFLLGGEAEAQNKQLAPSKDIEQVLRSVAGNVMQRTTFRLINTQTGKAVENSENLSVESGYKVESPYNDWKYWNGVMNLGFLELGEILNDPQFTEYAKKNVSFGFDHDAFIKKCSEAKVSFGGMSQKYRMRLLDDCGAMGASVLAVNAIDEQDRYEEYLNRAADYIMNKEKRLSDGTFCRNVPFAMAVWGDDLYMSVPFLARMGVATGDVKYFNEAAKQVFLFNKHLWNEQKQLYYHAWYDDIQENGVALWGRCNGWVAMAQVELLDKIPADHPQKQELIQLLNLSNYWFEPLSGRLRIVASTIR